MIPITIPLPKAKRMVCMMIEMKIAKVLDNIGYIN